MSRRWGAPTVGLAVALAIAGCGTESLSTRDLRNKATAICQTAGKQTNRLTPPSGPAGAAAYISNGAAILRPQLAGLRTLHAPSDLAQVYTTAIDGFARKLDALDAAARDLRAGGDPVTVMRSLQTKLGTLETQEDGAWQALEIPACLNR
jgi:hypothetical protein